jgi:hypothetical protein
MFFASDELYLQAGGAIPLREAYEGFPQHENGIGMARAFYDEIEELEQGVGPDPVSPTGSYSSLPAAPAEGYRAPRLLPAMTGATGEAGEVCHPGSPGAAGKQGDPIVVVTGEYGSRVLAPALGRLARLAGRVLRLLPVPNRFFGGNVAVTGLLVGADIRATLAKDREPAARYLLADVALSGDRFLDDMTVTEVAAAAPAPVLVVPTSAAGIMAGARP